MYSKDSGKDQMLMTMERELTSGQKAACPGGAARATTAIISTARKPGFVRKNPSGRRIAHGGYTDAVGRYIDLG